MPPGPSVWVILPTYNEADNLERLVGEVRGCRPPRRVLVVDDNSPDGTGDLADRLAVQHEEVEVLHRRRKEGSAPPTSPGFARPWRAAPR